MKPGQGTVLWLTGLPCSGKSTIADKLEKYYLEQGLPVQVIDGDLLRSTISKDLGFSKTDRYKQSERAAFIANMLSAHGINVIVALISPYHDMRLHARAICRQMKEIYIECSPEECIKRDVKGMYRMALAGAIHDFTGVQDPYEIPTAPDLVVNTEQNSLHQCVISILSFTER